MCNDEFAILAQTLSGLRKSLPLQNVSCSGPLQRVAE